MLKAVGQGDSGTVVILGFEPENLERLRALEPIVFPLAELDLGEGSFAICMDRDSALLDLALPEDVVVGRALLSDDDLRLLQEEGSLLRPLREVGLEMDGEVLFLQGRTPEEMIDTLKASGLIAADVEAADPGPLPISAILAQEVDAFFRDRLPRFYQTHRHPDDTLAALRAARDSDRPRDAPVEAAEWDSVLQVKAIRTACRCTIVEGGAKLPDGGPLYGTYLDAPDAFHEVTGTQPESARNVVLFAGSFAGLTEGHLRLQAARTLLGEYILYLEAPPGGRAPPASVVGIPDWETSVVILGVLFAVLYFLWW